MSLPGINIARRTEQPGVSPRSRMDVSFAVTALLVGIVLGLLTITVPFLAIGAAIFLFLVLPWLLKKPFWFYLWLIVSWPVLSLYVRVEAGSLPSITYERLLVPILAGQLLIQGLAFHKKLPSISIFILGYVGGQVAARLAAFFFGGTGSLDIIYFFNIVVLPVVMYWITRTYVTSRARIKYLLYALIIVAIIVCLSGMYERAIHAVVSPFPIGTHSAIGESRWLDVPGGRAAGIMANPAIFGGVVGTGIFAAMCCFVDARSKLARYLMGAAILFLLYGVLISFTRAAWLSVFGVLFVLQFVIGKFWKIGLPLYALTALILLVIGSSLISSDVLQNRILNPATVDARIDMAQVAVDAFVERPILGWGPDSYNAFIFNHVQGATQSFGASSSHNTYFTMLVDGGLVLLLSFVAMVASFIIKAISVIRRSLPGSFDRSVMWAMIGSIIVFLLLGFTNDLRDFIYYNVLLFIIAGIIDNVLEMNRAEATAQSEALTVERQPTA